jgi:hypothetical protein
MTQTTAFPVPPEVIKYVRSVFRACDKRLGLRIERVPNVQESSLDHALIDELNTFASPAVVAPDWTVKIDTHFLGGRRHFYSWEVADIGVLVYLRIVGKLYATKVALLQSKRLNPAVGTVEPEERIDYEMGFGGLMPSKDPTLAVSKPKVFKFDEKSRYKSLKTKDQQAKVMSEFEDKEGIPVHYLFYNPWNVPSSMTTPLTGKPKLSGAGNAGMRVVPVADVRQLLIGKADSYSPSFKDIQGLVGTGRHLPGWRLDYFVADLVMACKQGTLLEQEDTDFMDSLFRRRSGPISAAFAITIDKSDAH